MGGENDTSGYVEKQTIEDVINDFGLTINIQEFLEKVDGDRLNFAAFCDLFETPFDDTKSMVSLKSVDPSYEDRV
jgi:hypothetical protein